MPAPAAPRPLVVRVGDEREDHVRLTAWVHGQVQGVGFRWWTRARALELGLVGTATNLADGRVEVVAEGRRRDCDALLAHFASGRTPGIVDGVATCWSATRGAGPGFGEG